MILTIAMAAAAVPAGQAFTCHAIRIWDGDGPIWCAEGPRIRLAGIGVRELDGRCRPYQPCAGSSGIAARDHLVRLLGGSRGRTVDGHIVVRSTLRCVSAGDAKGGRTAAWCRTSGDDLSCRMIRDGFARRWETFWKKGACS
ncbi:MULTISPECIES: thermonuclease family protein [unclassified Sphingobium]|uniref:thermonuclease family protein n=1 Tax=unclassified Sphingobium TaxID=2611147 RepID=UPI0035A62636